MSAMFQAPVGTCDGGEEAYQALKQRKREIIKESRRLTDMGFEHRFAAIAYSNQTWNELQAIERDLFTMSFVTGQSILCRKGKRVLVGACRECHEVWKGIDDMGGFRAALGLMRQPGDDTEWPLWKLGWIAGLEGDSVVPESVNEEWRKWYQYGRDFVAGHMERK